MRANIKSNFRYKDIMDAIQQLEEMGGVKDSNEYVDILRMVECEIRVRINTASNSENFDGSRLSENTRDAICQYLAECHNNGSFGAGEANDYIWNGVHMPGLNNMTDFELVDELEYMTDMDDELLIKAKGELGIEEMLGE